MTTTEKRLLAWALIATAIVIELVLAIRAINLGLLRSDNARLIEGSYRECPPANPATKSSEAKDAC